MISAKRRFETQGIYREIALLERIDISIGDADENERPRPLIIMYALVGQMICSSLHVFEDDGGLNYSL